MSGGHGAIDHVALGWIKPEVDALLQQARISVEAWADGADTADALEACVPLLQQVQGSLQLMDLDTPVRLVDEMRQLVQALQQGLAVDAEAAATALLQGLVQLPDYLEWLQAGHRDLPDALLPLIDAQRAARRAPVLERPAAVPGSEETASDAELAGAQAAMRGRNRALLASVAVAVKEDLMQVKDALDLHVRGAAGDVTRLGPQAEALGRIADTLGLVGLDAHGRNVAAQREVLQAMVEGRQPVNEEALSGVVATLLRVDAWLDDADPWQPSDGAEDTVVPLPRQDLAAMLQQAGANMERVREGIAAAVQSPSGEAATADLPGLLRDVSGALRIVEQTEAAELVSGVEACLVDHLQDAQATADPAAMEHLADAVTGLELYLQDLAEGRRREALLVRVRSALAALAGHPEPAVPASSLHAQDDDENADLREQHASANEPMAEVPAAALAASGFEDTGGMVDDEVRAIFLEEFEEEMAHLAQRLPPWRAQPDNLALLQPIRRVFHTLKGSGRLVGARQLGELSWKVEEVLNRVLDGSHPASQAVVSLVEQAQACLPQLHAALKGQGAPPQLEALEQAAVRMAAGEELSLAPLPDAPVATPAVEDAAAAESVADGLPASVDAVLLEILDAEITGHVQTITHWLQSAETLPLANEALLRALHTCNGAFAMTDVPVITEVLSPAEGYVKRLLGNALPASGEGVAALAALVATVQSTMQALHAVSPRIPEAPELVARLQALRDGLPEAPAAPRVEDDADIAPPLDALGVDLSQVTPEAIEPLEALPDAPAEIDHAAIRRREAALLEAERIIFESAEAERRDAAQVLARQWAEEQQRRREEAERLAAEQAEAQRLAEEQAAAERLEAERLAAEQAEAQRLAEEQAEAERLEAERLAAEQAEAQRLAEEQAEAERLEAERLAAEQAEAQRLAEEQAEAERLEAERLVAEQAEAQRLAEEQAAAERLEAERLAAEQAEAQRLAEEQAEAERLEAERLAAEQTKAQRLAEEAAAVRAQALRASADAVAASEDPDEALDLTGLDPDLIDLFLEEAGDLLDHSDGLLARLRETPEMREPISGLQRDLHTLKGGARMAGLMPVGDLGHAMESLLETAGTQQAALERDDIRLLEQALDRLHGMLTRVGARRAIGVPNALIAQLTARLAPGADAAGEPGAGLAPLSAPIDTALDEADGAEGGRASQEQVRIRADLLDRLVNYAGEVAIYRARLEQQLGAFRAAMREMEQTNTRLRDQLRRLDSETEAQIIARYQREQDAANPAFDPLELDRFSTLQQLSRGLAESAADMASLQGTLDDLTRQYESLLQQQSRVSSDLQEGLMRTRMVPFDALVPRLRRVVRQAATDTGKQVQLRIEGAHGELDRNVLERMTAPLEHLLRNAVAHGLEAPALRARAGKPEEGVVAVSVRREGSEVVLDIRDDGAGLDREAIRRRAEQRGLVRSDAVLGDAALDALILAPGFSTADEVSHVAGRGVGMNVVASEVRQLGGTLEIATQAGAGTTFTLRLPQTLAVTQAVFVRIGETTFAVPMASVQGVGRLPREDLDNPEAAYTYGEQTYALHDLGRLLGQAPARGEGRVQMPLLLIRSGELRAAVAIDQVLGNREIVVKPVGPQVVSIPGIFGATVMGDGSVVVILDIAPLVRRGALAPRQSAAGASAGEATQRRLPLVMVVDDSITMRKVTGRVLERHHCEVALAKDGIDALERMEDAVPDLMLLDIEMPRMDGYELAAAMRADPRLRDVPILMITSRTGEKHRQRAFELGVQRYLGKPYQEPELMRHVFELLGMEQTASEEQAQ